MIYTLKQGNKTVAVQNKRLWYVIGFPNITHARAVHYNIVPEPAMFLFRGAPTSHNIFQAYMESSLFIPKHTGDHWQPMNDGGFHIHAIDKKDFYGLINKGLGIVYAHNLKHEDTGEFTFDAHVFEPTAEGSEL